METLADLAIRQKLMVRIKGVRPDSARMWGRMTPHQMLCHLSDSFLAVLGEK